MTANPPDDIEDDPSFPALDRYLEELHAGKCPDRAKLLVECPALAGMLDCLDALERLAVPPAAHGAANPDDALTLEQSAEAPVPPPTTPAPANFGNYELLCELGRGGMGVVYKARQKDLDRIVALKMILASHLDSTEYVERFRDEMRAAAGLDHPHIIRIHEAGQVNGQPYFAMQYIAGPSLAALARQGLMPPERAARLVAAVARGIAHLHGKKFVHRDLKPSNILLDEKDHPYVTDFGLVKMLQTDSHKTTTGAVLGTPSYMSPEQAAGNALQVGPASDVYSLGAILFELLTGRPPFRAATPLDTLVQVIEGEPPRPTVLNRYVPHDLETICLKCLEKAPEDRYASSDALADDLERFLQGEEIAARQARPLARFRRWTRREPALASRLIVLAICSLIIQIRYHLTEQVDSVLHAEVMAGFALWGMASLAFQCLLRQREDAGWIPFGWATADAVLLTGLLVLDNAVNTPFLIAYHCLVATSGLWFRVALVWFTTALALTGYGVVLTYGILTGEVIQAPHQHVVYVVGLILVGFVTAYQVKRVRALSRYYESRPLPR